MNDIITGITVPRTRNTTKGLIGSLLSKQTFEKTRAIELIKNSRPHLPCDTSVLRMNYFIYPLTSNIQQIHCTTYSANKQTLNTNQILQSHVQYLDCCRITKESIIFNIQLHDFISTIPQIPAVLINSLNIRQTI
uniref:Phlebovirus_G2 domain-containing protein n=1 Tax=Heterorhabditis bacteriophora TaxID=37862 RepID=A0A1I7WV16_HETBA